MDIFRVKMSIYEGIDYDQKPMIFVNCFTGQQILTSVPPPTLIQPPPLQAGMLPPPPMQGTVYTQSILYN